MKDSLCSAPASESHTLVAFEIRLHLNASLFVGYIRHLFENKSISQRIGTMELWVVVKTILIVSLQKQFPLWRFIQFDRLNWYQ